MVPCLFQYLYLQVVAAVVFPLADQCYSVQVDVVQSCHQDCSALRPVQYSELTQCLKPIRYLGSAQQMLAEEAGAENRTSLGRFQRGQD